MNWGSAPAAAELPLPQPPSDIELLIYRQIQQSLQLRARLGPYGIVLAIAPDHASSLQYESTIVVRDGCINLEMHVVKGQLRECRRVIHSIDLNHPRSLECSSLRQLLQYDWQSV